MLILLLLIHGSLLCRARALPRALGGGGGDGQAAWRESGNARAMSGLETCRDRPINQSTLAGPVVMDEDCRGCLLIPGYPQESPRELGQEGEDTLDRAPASLVRKRESCSIPLHPTHSAALSQHNSQRDLPKT